MTEPSNYEIQMNYGLAVMRLIRGIFRKIYKFLFKKMN